MNSNSMEPFLRSASNGMGSQYFGFNNKKEAFITHGKHMHPERILHYNSKLLMA